ncbi:MAG: Fur family transcriptional regulator [Hyphomicrobiales bacterium]|nr:Fur family transcriptional regulator [Hyphomicrobiales bacterium]
MKDDHKHGHAPAPGSAHDGCAHAHGHIRLTPARQLVLDKLCAAGRPVGAYDMIDLVADETGKRPAPVSIYRALDFLLENGLVHRLASRNAFMACAHRHERSATVAFLICESCGKVREATSADVAGSLEGLAAETGFHPKSQVIELTGICRDCAGSAAA